MRKLAVSIFYIFIASIILYPAIILLKLDASKICENGFLFNFLGILLGFSLTIFTFIVSMVEKVKDRADAKFEKDEDKKKKLQKIIDSLYTEIKDNIFFNFFSLILIGLSYLLPTSQDSFSFLNFEFKSDLISNSIKLAIFLLNLYAVYDLIMISFKLSDTVGILKKAEDETGA